MIYFALFKRFWTPVMGKLSIEELLEAGIPLEDILAKRDPANININVSLEEFSKVLQNVLYEMKGELVSNNKQNKDLLLTSLQALFKQNQINQKKEKPAITGLKVVRNELNLITDLRFIREV